MASLLILVVLVVIVASVMLFTYFTFDRLIRRQHDEHVDEWIADGRPIGMFWRPDGARFSFRSRWAMDKCTWAWLFRSPGWASRDQEALRLLRRYRVLVAVSYIGIAVVLAAAIHARTRR
jgi:hypothetical protein